MGSATGSTTRVFCSYTLTLTPHSLPRAGGLTFVKASPTCLAVPLRCGAPLEYLDWAMLGSLGAGVVTSFVAFGAAARAIEVASTKGWVRRFPSSSE
jgi:hypothetical protein